MTQSFLAAKVVNGYPLVTLSRRSDRFPLGLASALPATLARRPGLHLVQPAWYIDEAAAQVAAAEWHRYRQQAPGARVVFLNNDPAETVRLGGLGLPAHTASVGAFIEEAPWIAPALGGRPDFDAVYNAALLPFKRHLLASAVDSLALIYRPDRPHRREAACEDLRRQLPRARFLNHEAGQGVYRPFDAPATARQVMRSRVGLALSRREGLMRACIEYLLAGLPVVTTASEGGRARWLLGPWAREVADTPEAVAQAVEDFCRAGPSPAEVRAAGLALLAAERDRVREVLRAVCADTFGADAPVLQVPEQFRGVWTFRPLGRVRAELQALGMACLDRSPITEPDPGAAQASTP